MTDFDCTPYLSLKYGFGEGQYNCIDLCRKFYKDQGYKETFTDERALPLTLEEFNKHHKLHLMKYLVRNFDASRDINQCEFGDIVVFEILGDLHTGVYVGNHQVLAMQVPCIEGKSQSMVYKFKIWSLAFRYLFKRRKGDNQ